MAILITGVAGFIGSNLADQLLSEGFRIVGIDNYDGFYERQIKERNIASALLNKNFRFLPIDICNSDELDALPFDIDTVIHLAAKTGIGPSLLNPKGYIQANIAGTASILEWIRLRGIKKMIFASSSSVYGNNAKTPFSENDIVDQPISPYAFTKKACELMNYTYHKLYGISIVNLRFFTVYGERQRPDLAIHKFVKAISENRPIQMFGNGETARDYTYVKDTIRGIQSSIDLLNTGTSIYEIINLGNSHPVKLSELIELIGTALGRKPIVETLPSQPGDVERTYADIAKAHELLNYSPGTTLEEGLKNFVAWFKQNQM